MHNEKHSNRLLQLFFAAVLLVLFTVRHSIAQTYTTLTDGNWSNVTNVWSLDGVTPCGCMPPNPTAGVDIDVFHNLTLGFDLDITGGSQVYLRPGTSSLIGGGSTITVVDGYFRINSSLDVQGLDIPIGGTVDVYGYVQIQTNNSMDIYGVMNVLGGYFQANSSINVMSTGTLILQNYTKLESNAAFSNEGYIYVCDVCCIEISGQVTNEATGTINGTGAWNTVSGTTKNFGYWDPAMSWCSAGNDVGMPSAEDCPTSEAICNAIILSVSFGAFEVNLEDERAFLSWTTISENDNDYFVIERAKDNFVFNQKGIVDGAGTTEIEQSYSFIDQLNESGKYYYRLKQVDFDGTYEYSDVVSVDYVKDSRSVIGVYNLLGQEVDRGNYSGLIVIYYSDGTTEKIYQP